MAHFFIRSYGPIFWSGCVVLLIGLGWVCAPSLWGSHLTWAALLSGAIGGGIMWSRWHFLSGPMPRNYLMDPPMAGPPLGQLAGERSFWIGTIGFSRNLAPLEGVLGRDFNSLTPGYETKWKHLLVGGVLGRYDFSAVDRLVDFSLARGARVRGHTLVWGQDGLPDNLVATVRRATNPAACLRTILEDHIATVLGHFHGRIQEWDVVNEPLDASSARFHPNIFHRVLGEEFVDFVFRCARRADPGCRLFLNEQFWNYTDRRARCFLALIRRLRERGVPVDGIGLQSHVNLPPVPRPDEFKTYLAEISALGYDIEITEFDVLLWLFRRTPDPYAAQGEYFRAMLQVCLQEPACRGFTVWGLSDGDAWYHGVPHFAALLPHAPFLFDEAMHPKPAYRGLWAALRGPGDDAPAR